MNGTSHTAPSRVERRTQFVEILRRTPPRTICPNFYALSHANGCAFAPACDYCYLQSALWYLEAIDELPVRSPVGLCEETAEAWTAMGLDPESKACNCGT